MEIKYNFDGDEYVYEFDEENSLIFEMSKEFKISKEQAKSIINELELHEKLRNRYYDNIKEDCESKAWYNYKDDIREKRELENTPFRSGD